MLALFKYLGVGVAALAIACGNAPSADVGPVGGVSRGGSQAAASRALPNAEGGSGEIPPPTEEELRRLLDALEQEIGER